MALRTTHRHAVETPHHRGNHVVAIQMPSHLAIDLGFGNFCMPDEIPGPSGDHSKRFDAIGCPWIQYISCNLLLNEPAIRLIAIERVDHVVSVRPSVRTHFVLVVTVSLAKMHHIKPVPSPTFSVTRGIQQLIDDPSVSFIISSRITDESR